VLLRPEWGNTAWTRIEETAIRNRAYSQGYNFATFIVTVPRTPIPDWLPVTSIWYDLERFGSAGAAAVLENRVRECGGVAVQETLADRAARLERARDFNQQREAFHRSYEGVKAAQDAHRRLVDDFKANREPLQRAGCRIQDVAYGDITMLVGHSVVLTVQFEHFYANNLDKAALTAEFYDGVPPLPGIDAWNKPRTLKKWKFTFGLLGPGRPGWVGPDGKEHALEALAEFLLGHFIELQQRQLGQAE
jgi:hypothetical protein